MTILDVVDLSIAAGGRTLLTGVTISVGPGESVAVMGPSGSGKTSLLQTVAGLRRTIDGSVTLDGNDMAALPRQERDHLRLSLCGMVYQFGELLPELTATENVALPGRYLGLGRKIANLRAIEWLATLGVGELADSRPDKLSGGQVQRVAIARAMAHNPKLLLADEPTGMLDSDTSRQVMRTLLECVRTQGAGLVFVTHDHAIAAMADRRYEVADHQLVAA